MASLVERIRKARQTRVTHEGKTFIVSRPTDWQVFEISRTGKSTQMDVLESYVVGWEGFAELDLVPGGDATVVPFDKELFSEWAQDHPEFWSPLTAAITAEYTAHKEKQEEAAKK
jgi:hypothetical protein